MTRSAIKYVDNNFGAYGVLMENRWWNMIFIREYFIVDFVVNFIIDKNIEVKNPNKILFDDFFVDNSDYSKIIDWI